MYGLISGHSLFSRSLVSQFALSANWEPTDSENDSTEETDEHSNVSSSAVISDAISDVAESCDELEHDLWDVAGSVSSLRGSNISFHDKSTEHSGDRSARGTVGGLPADIPASWRRAMVRCYNGHRLSVRDLVRVVAGVAVGGLNFTYRLQVRRSDLQKLSDEERRRVLDASSDFVAKLCKQGPLSASTARCAATVDKSLELASNIATSGVVQDYAIAGKGPAIPIQASQLSLPPAHLTGQFDAARFMPADVQHAFVFPESLCSDLTRPTKRRANVFCQPGHERAIFERLDAVNMIELEVGLDSRIASGLFAVPKDLNKQRLITSRLVANAQERSIGASKELFPHSSQFCDVLLGPSQSFKGYTTDLSNFYHQVGLSRSRSRRTILGKTLLFDLVEHLQAGQRLLQREKTRPSHVHVVQRTMPMGDVNATDFGQISHCGLLRVGGVALPDELCSYSLPLPFCPSLKVDQSSALQFVMIDDNVVFSFGPNGGNAATSVFSAPDRGEQLFRASHQAYAQAGAAIKEEKSVVGEESFEALGARVANGKVSARDAHLSVLATGLGFMHASGQGSLSLLETSTALAVHVLMFRRDAFSLLSCVFHEVINRRKQSKRSHLPPAVRSEMGILLAMLPLLRTDLRTPVSTTVLAADASGGQWPRAGCCETTLSQACVSELWRLRPTKSRNVMLSSEVRHDVQTFLEAIGETAPVDDFDVTIARYRRVADDLGRCCVWRGAFGVNLPRNEHINLSEYRASRIAIRRVLKKERNVRLLSLSDSNVVTCSAVRGRSRSKKLLMLQRQLLPELLLYNVYLGWYPISTSANPADAPSRRRVLPQKSDNSIFPDFFSTGSSVELERVLRVRAEREFRDRWIVTNMHSDFEFNAEVGSGEWRMSADDFVAAQRGTAHQLGDLEHCQCET